MGNAFDGCTPDEENNPLKDIPEYQKIKKRNPLQIQKESEAINKSTEVQENKENNIEKQNIHEEVEEKEKLPKENEKQPEQEKEEQQKPAEVQDEKQKCEQEEKFKQEPEQPKQETEDLSIKEVKQKPKQEEKIKVTTGMQTDDLPQPIKRTKKKRNPPNLDIHIKAMPDTEKSTSPLMRPSDQQGMPSERPTEYLPEEVKNVIEKQTQENKNQKGKKANRRKMPVLFNEDEIFDEKEQAEQSNQYKLIMNYNKNTLSNSSISTTTYQDKDSTDLPLKMTFHQFINFEQRKQYKSFVLGGDQYLEEDFKLIHLTQANQFFIELGKLESIVNLNIKFANVYGSAGIIKLLVDAIIQLPQLTTLDLDLTPNYDLLNKLVECNENIKMAKIKKSMIAKSKFLKKELSTGNEPDETEIQSQELENQINLLIKEQKQTYKTYRSYLLTTNEAIQLIAICNLPNLQKLMLNLSLNRLDETAIQGMLSYCSEMNQLKVLKLNCLTQFSGIFKENQQQYYEFLKESLKQTEITFS